MRASTCSWVASASLGPPHSRRRLACTCECGIPLVRAYCATSELSSLRLLARARCSATVGSARSRRSWRLPLYLPLLTLGEQGVYLVRLEQPWQPEEVLFVVGQWFGMQP